MRANEEECSGYADGGSENRFAIGAYKQSFVAESGGGHEQCYLKCTLRKLALSMLAKLPPQLFYSGLLYGNES